MLEKMLTAAPELEAKTLFDWLCEQQPGKYQDGKRSIAYFTSDRG